MKVLIKENFGGRIFRNLSSIFIKEQEEKEKTNFKTIYELRTEKDYGARLEKMQENELDRLWEMQRKRAEGLCSEGECRESISESFTKMQDCFSKAELNGISIWPKYVKIALYAVEEPIYELLQYVKEDNYIVLTKRFSDLSVSIQREGEEWIKSNAERFGKALYQHILEEINPEDVPSGLALGRYFQRRGEYEMAKSYYEKIMASDTNTAFNGVTSMLALYEEEIKATLKMSKKNKSAVEEKEKANGLKNKQYEIYEAWVGKMEEQMQKYSELPEQYKRNYITLLSGYARFEKNRGNYNRAIALLKKVPEGFPDIYRIYVEEAMIYQFKSYSNPFYNIDKAIETFKKAEASMKDGEEMYALTAKNKKCILMPLANSYFLCGRYEEADAVCDQVLQIDQKETRAITLKSKIASQMSFYDDFAV